jgi:hypothetical protein
MKLLRPLAGYTLYYQKTNDSIRRELQIACILDKIDKCRLNWHLHLQSVLQNRISLKSYHYRPQGRRTKNAGESSCSSGDGTDRRVQSLMFVMMMMMKIIIRHDTFLISEPNKIKVNRSYFLQFIISLRDGHCGARGTVIVSIREGPSLWVPAREGHCDYPRGTAIVSTRGGRSLWVTARDGRCEYAWGTTIVDNREGRSLWVPVKDGHCEYPPQAPKVQLWKRLSVQYFNIGADSFLLQELKNSRLTAVFL